MKHKDLRPWLRVIAGGESLVSHAGATLLIETARRSGLAGQLSRLLGPWRLRAGTHDPCKVVLDLALAVALSGDAACDVAVLRAQPQVFGPVASDPTVSRRITRLAEDADAVLDAINSARATARERVWSWAGAPTQDGMVVLVWTPPCWTRTLTNSRRAGPGRRGSGSIRYSATSITVQARHVYDAGNETRRSRVRWNTPPR